jgi:hypothetical protein
MILMTEIQMSLSDLLVAIRHLGFWAPNITDLAHFYHVTSNIRKIGLKTKIAL